MVERTEERICLDIGGGDPNRRCRNHQVIPSGWRVVTICSHTDSQPIAGRGSGHANPSGGVGLRAHGHLFYTQEVVSLLQGGVQGAATIAFHPAREVTGEEQEVYFVTTNRCEHLVGHGCFTLTYQTQNLPCCRINQKDRSEIIPLAMLTDLLRGTLKFLNPTPGLLAPG